MGCGTDLSDILQVKGERRQVLELPALRVRVSGHQAVVRRRRCGVTPVPTSCRGEGTRSSMARGSP